MFRLSRPFQNICTAYNARALHNLSSQPATYSSAVNHVVKRASTFQVRTLSASAASLRNASFAFNGGQIRSGIWGSKGLVSASALAGLGFGLAAFQIQRPAVLCEAPPTSPAAAPPRASPTPEPDALPPPPRSSIKIYELGFGTVAGICAGVFIKKGAKALAFLLGGVFVMLQYFTSLRLVRVNWSSAESRFQDTFYSRTTDVGGQEVRRPPTVYSLWRWLVDFLTADFPPRATFIAGMALGLRIG